ncbi:MAG: Spo0E family sporulation regulatory protein-aspartic acid phosphatase [Sulfobacillus sp.]
MLRLNRILEEIQVLRRELERIYAMTNDMSHPDLLQTSRELDLLLVQYLESERQANLLSQDDPDAECSS